MVGSGFFIADELDGFVVDRDVDLIRGSNQIQDNGLVAAQLDEVLRVVLGIDNAADFFIQLQFFHSGELQFGGDFRNVVTDDFGINVAPVVIINGNEIIFVVGLIFVIHCIVGERIFVSSRSFFLCGSLFSRNFFLGGSLFCRNFFLSGSFFCFGSFFLGRSFFCGRSFFLSGSFFIIIIGRNRLIFRFRSGSFFLGGSFFHYSVFFLIGSLFHGGSRFLSGGFFLSRNFFLYYNRKFFLFGSRFLGRSSFLCNLFNLHRFTLYHGSLDRFFCKGQRAGKQQRYRGQQRENFLEPIHHDPYLTLVVLVVRPSGFGFVHFASPVT